MILAFLDAASMLERFGDYGAMGVVSGVLFWWHFRKDKLHRAERKDWMLQTEGQAQAFLEQAETFRVTVEKQFERAETSNTLNATNVANSNKEVSNAVTMLKTLVETLASQRRD